MEKLGLTGPKGLKNLDPIVIFDYLLLKTQNADELHFGKKFQFSEIFKTRTARDNLVKCL